jgi:hypothetical protein
MTSDVIDDAYDDREIRCLMGSQWVVMDYFHFAHITKFVFHQQNLQNNLPVMPTYNTSMTFSIGR